MINPVKHAGFWLRLVAYGFDNAVFYIPDKMLLPLVWTNLFEASEDSLFWGDIILITLNFFYFAIMESSKYQGTIGKMIVGVIVTDTNGNRISFLRATGRYWAKIISYLTIYVGFIMAAFTNRKRALHDIIAGTLIIVKPKKYKFIRKI